MKSQCLNINNCNPQIKLNNSKIRKGLSWTTQNYAARLRGTLPSQTSLIHTSPGLLTFLQPCSGFIWSHIFLTSPALIFYASFRHASVGPRRKDSPVNSGASHTDDSCRWPSLSTRSVWSPSRTSCSILSQQCIYASLFVQPCATYHLSGGSRADMAAR